MKRIFSGLLLLAAISLSALEVYAHDLLVKRNSNFRQDPTSFSDLIVKLKSGDEVVLLDIKPVNGYYHAMHKDRNGWVWARNVTVIQEYERTAWKHWTDEDGDCQKTRDEVLIAESEIPVTFKTTDNCKVTSGRWTDPYTGEVFTDPGDLDVDHMVPLQNAHRSGGWQFSYQTRRAYANDLDNSEHLIAVKASANRSKGSKGPENWKPSNQAYWCQYATDWEGIKIRWELTITEDEDAALEEMKESCP